MKPCAKYSLSALFLIFSAVLLIYWPGSDVPWLMDDFPNILHNANLHMEELTPKSLKRALTSSQGLQNRPISYLSFAVNWYFGKKDVSGYRAVNMAIHAATAYLCYLVIFSLSFASNRRKDSSYHHNLALMSAFIWAVHPVHVMAVTYIVQRMTQLAALFYLLGIYFYISGRLVSGRKRLFYYSCCALSFLLSAGSKESAVTFPISLLLLEHLFFAPGNGKRRYAAAGLFLTAAAVAFVFLLPEGGFNSVLDGYLDRPFDIFQRTMTQSRILIFYVSLLFYPALERFSIFHGPEVSKGLFAPPETLLCIMAVFMIIAAGVWIRRTRPLCSFALLFFFLAHSVESSILPLEMVFEHRNYLPSAFAFVPVSILFLESAQIRQRMDLPSKIFKYLLISGTVFAMAGIGIGTLKRNMIFSDQVMSWKKAMVKYPQSARPYLQLAEIAEGDGKLKLARFMYKKALLKKDPRPAQAIALAYNNLAGIEKSMGRYKEAEAYYKRALAALPDYHYAAYNLALLYAERGRLNEALVQASRLIEKKVFLKEAYSLSGMIHLANKEFLKAREEFSEAFRLDQKDRNTWINLALGLSYTGECKMASWYIANAETRFRDDILVLLARLQVALACKEPHDEKQATEKILRLYSLDLIKSSLAGIRALGDLSPFSIEKLYKRLESALSKKREELYPDRG